MNRKFPLYLYTRKYKTRGGYLRTLYYCRFVDWKGVPRTFPAGPDFKSAKLYGDKLRGRNAQGEDFDAIKPVGMTFSAWKVRYLDLEANKRSIERDRQHIEHLEKFFGPMLLKDIYGSKIIEYKNLRLASPITRYKRAVDGTKVSLSTVQRELSCLRHMLNLAWRDRLIDGVPYIEFESEKHLARERTLTDEELEKLLETMPVWLRRVCELAVETSWDRGDLLGLTWTENVVRVPALTLKLAGRQKTKVKAQIPVLPGSRLEGLLNELSEERSKIRPIGDQILTRDGKRVTKDMVRKNFELAVKEAGIKDWRFKDFRHQAKTKWAAMGVPAEVAMAMAGHASAQMHYRYVNLKDHDIRRALENARATGRGAT